jgi:hypothetical protein
MKIEYHLTPHRVIQCQVRLRGTLNVEQVLSASVFCPPLLRVHVETQKCCSDPEFALDGSSSLTDARLARFVAVEGSVFEVHCDACKKVTSVDSQDLSLLHWRSHMELRAWLPLSGLDTVQTVLSKSTVTLPNGQEELWNGQEVLVNQAPSVLLPLADADGETRLSAPEFLHLIAQLRTCIHPRLQPCMLSVVKRGKVYVALRQKRLGQRVEQFFFMVKQRPRCVGSWPREFIQEGDGYSVVAAFKLAQGACGLADFLQSVVQCITIAPEEYLFVVNWMFTTEPLQNYKWVSEVQTNRVYGFSIKWPWIQMALGSSNRWKLYHGTSMEAGTQIEASGFETHSFHSCSGSYYKCNPPHACSCKGMLGPGVYLATFEKASSNAGRVAGPNKLAAVLECAVEVGECKLVTPYSSEFCHCGCSSLYSDHVASWYHEQLFDSILLCRGAGVKREEMCVRRPLRVSVRDVHHVAYNSDRERVFCSLVL